MRLRFLLPTVLAFATALPTGTYAQTGISRLVGAAYQKGDAFGIHFVPADSEAYVYSGTNTGAPVNVGSLENPYMQYKGKYDTLTTFMYGSAAIGYYTTMQTYEIFDVTNNLLYQTTQTYDTAGHTWNNAYRYAYTYDAHNNTTSQLYQVWDASSSGWRDSTRSGYTYDGSDNMVTDTFTNLSNASRNTLYTYYYDASHGVTSYIYMKWSTSSSSFVNNSKMVYVPSSSTPTSDTAYRYFGSAWVYSNSDIYTYSSSNLIADTTKGYFGGNWFNSRLNAYTYDGSNNQIADTTYAWSISASKWNDTFYYANSFDASHNELTTYKYQYYSGTGWVLKTRDSMTYNSYNQCLSYTTNDWNPGLGGGAGGWEEVNGIQNIYHYQIAASVPTLQKAAGSVQVYPSPANSRLNIDLKWNNAQSAVIGIYDMNGRIWSQLRTENTASYHNAIPVSQLPAGNYVIKVKGDAGQLTQTFTVVH